MLGQAAAYTSCVCVCFANNSEVDNYLHARVLFLYWKTDGVCTLVLVSLYWLGQL